MGSRNVLFILDVARISSVCPFLPGAGTCEGAMCSSLGSSFSSTINIVDKHTYRGSLSRIARGV